jgi:PIN domain nuclease of toxin-antitoxin system
MAASLLLDTHALLWWLVEPEKLSALALASIHDPAATIFVSAATGWELATKVRLGKLPGAEGLLQELPAILQQQGFQLLAVQLRHGLHAGSYRQSHRDPFDRLLAAQAELEGLPLVSVDPALAAFPCRLLW